MLKDIDGVSDESNEYEAQKKRKKCMVDVENVNEEVEELMKHPDIFENEELRHGN